MGSRKIAANDELLAAIHAILDKGAAWFSRLVVAVLLFPDIAFQPLLAHRRQEVPWRSLEIIRDLILLSRITTTDFKRARRSTNGTRVKSRSFQVGGPGLEVLCWWA